MPNATRSGDKVRQAGPHCHAPIHPAAPVPTPVPHQAQDLEIISQTAGTVLINKKQAAILASLTRPCNIAVCVPGGPGIIAKGSMTVLIEGSPAARVGDMTTHASCGASVIPAGVGTVQGMGSPNVFIGG